MTYSSFSIDTYFGRYMDLSKDEMTEIVAANPEDELARNRLDDLLVRECKDKTEKIKLLQAAAARGCPSAQCYLAAIYHDKKGTEERAITLLKMAADSGIEEAQQALVDICAKDIKGKKDEAFKLMIRAAATGYATAQALVSAYYGEGIMKNDAKAFHFASLSSAQGNRVGQFRLGSLLSDGVGCEKDEEKAIEIFTEVAESGLTSAMIILGRLHVKRGCVGGDPVNDQPLRAEQVPHFEKAFHWFKKAIEQGKCTLSLRD
jgi:TPR repeat protein